jgi:cell wall-associated NlpC family hydrolase
MNLRTRVTVVITGVALAAAAVLPAASGAAPIDDKRRQAAELQRQIDANDQDLVAMSEKLNGAVYRQRQAEAGIAEAEARTKASESERRRIRRELGRRAAQIYRSAGTSTPLAQIDVSSVTEMTSRSKYAAAAAERDDQLVAKLQKVEEDLAVKKADLERQKAAAASEVKAAESARASIADANRRARALQNQIQGDIARIMQEQAAAQAAASRRAAAQRANQATQRATAPSGGGSQAQVTFPDAPAPNGGAAAAVAFAKAQVGKSYRYATSGPDSFDCSGLTAAAWARGGVSLAHYSGAQYQQTIRISANDLQPGDLVFYGSGGSNHVEIYIGGGMVVSASNPSSGVKLAGVRYGSASGYGRVRA